MKCSELKIFLETIRTSDMIPLHFGIPNIMKIVVGKFCPQEGACKISTSPKVKWSRFNIFKIKFNEFIKFFNT